MTRRCPRCAALGHGSRGELRGSDRGARGPRLACSGGRDSLDPFELPWPPPRSVRRGPRAPRSDDRETRSSNVGSTQLPQRRCFPSSDRGAGEPARTLRGGGPRCSTTHSGLVPPEHAATVRPPRDPRHAITRARSLALRDGTKASPRARTSLDRFFFFPCTALSAMPVERRAAGARRKSRGGRQKRIGPRRRSPAEPWSRAPAARRDAQPHKKRAALQRGPPLELAEALSRSWTAPYRCRRP